MKATDSNDHIDPIYDQFDEKENTQIRLNQVEGVGMNAATNLNQRISVESNQKSQKRVLVSKENVVPNKRSKTEKMPNPSVRFNDVRHPPKIDKSKLVRCKNEGCNKKTYVFCSKCNVHLCICIADNRNCFDDFHTIKKDSDSLN